MSKIYDKLVRDRIPEVIEDDGKEYSVTQTRDPELLRDYALKKLREEVMEFVEDPCAEEAADILEILHFVCKRMNITETEISAARMSKYVRRGGFEMGHILEWVKE